METLATKIVEDVIKGNTFIKIMPVNEEGNINPEAKAVHSFGLKKAEAMLDHLDEIKEWVSKHPKRRKSE